MRKITRDLNLDLFTDSDSHIYIRISDLQHKLKDREKKESIKEFIPRIIGYI